jgi:excinuclease ABC subunit B
VEHGITPRTIEKEIHRGIEDVLRARKVASDAVRMTGRQFDHAETIAGLEKEMHAAAEKLDFERAAALRDEIRKFTKQEA